MSSRSKIAVAKGKVESLSSCEIQCERVRVSERERGVCEREALLMRI